ncbi:SIT4 phosphatase-associated protein-domain-containing protein [Crucibulum laeve]|uniref:SIT4 phosphatase-associated protein-domain-containing protein n=1 Tax=Crucibulum laeve TaxID=68775 RepID=A0A5C3LWX0_9AGAR|nr:SIT4 phosphatase-associated protein-domain-containing protein [Crucibulum laeve]
MFWRFGFHNASSIDSLLDREDVALEAILDEDDLLQECKSQNTRLIDYFARVDVLQKLLGYVTGQIESDGKGQFKYPYVATEVLCSEIWSIVETCIREQGHILVPFWETILDRPPDDMKTQMVMASHFAKVVSAFLSKKPAEMFAFIQAQPSIVERLLRHVETPAFPEILSRIIELDGTPVGDGSLEVLEWLSSQNFIGRLLDLLSPAHTSDIHTVVAELLKGIISLANPSPGAGVTEQNGPSSNRFARELADRDGVAKLVSYMLYDFSSIKTDLQDSSSSSPALPNVESATSSIVQSISVVVELIRKHNSDYFEPYLFHTLRNRLIQVQQQLHGQADGRETLEAAMKEMVDRMGVVHLGPLLEIMCARLEEFQKYLKAPRTSDGPISTTVGAIIPLTFERYRICELFAELLHCSNMSLLNRPAVYSRLYDSEGRLVGGLAALEELAHVIALNTSNERDEAMDEAQDEIEPALELPISGSNAHSSPSLDSDDSMSDDEPGSSDDEAMEEIAMYDEPGSSLELSPPSMNQSLPIAISIQQHPQPFVSSPLSASLSPPSDTSIGTSPFGYSSETSDTSTVPPRSPARSHTSRRSSKRTNTMDSSTDRLLPVGEQMKRKFLDLNLLSTVLDLFFDFPWNNFLHSAVYDVVHQVLTGNVENGLNRELAISLFRDAKILHRIIDGQKRNDAEISKPKGVRLGYMGHLTLISEDVLTALERFPPDLRLIILQYVPDPEWDQYVTGRYNETKTRDARLLGGGKPVVSVDAPRDRQRWAVDEEEVSTSGGGGSNGGGMRGEFRRASSVGPRREVSGGADFGPAPMEDDEDEVHHDEEAPQFASYLAQEMQQSDSFGGSSSDDDDDDEGWLTQSNFSLNNPPVSSRRHGTERRPLSSFDDAFNPQDEAARTMSEDPFNSQDDDGFGPFADTPGTVDPFTFNSAFPDDMEDAAFDDSFGDFGDFQSADSFHSSEGDSHDGDGEGGDLTPTAGSWTLAGSDSGVGDDFGTGILDLREEEDLEGLEKDRHKEKDKKREKQEK